jgi:YesN/AraC family two-component response regulator
MPKMNGLELYQKIVEIDPNIRVCFMSAAEVT